MRIIAGTFRSRRLEAPRGTLTRPTLDPVREAVFSALGGFFDGGSILDLYAGSGAIGLEALSRGMTRAVFCEKNRAAAIALRHNIQALQVEERTQVYPIAADHALRQMQKNREQFDLVYLDPPYQLQENEKVMRDLEARNMLTANARVVVEAAREDRYAQRYGHLTLYKETRHGITRVLYYQREETI